MTTVSLNETSSGDHKKTCPKWQRSGSDNVAHIRQKGLTMTAEKLNGGNYVGEKYM
jgi:hypothetical protein